MCVLRVSEYCQQAPLTASGNGGLRMSIENRARELYETGKLTEAQCAEVHKRLQHDPETAMSKYTAHATTRRRLVRAECTEDDSDLNLKSDDEEPAAQQAADQQVQQAAEQQATADQQAATAQQQKKVLQRKRSRHDFQKQQAPAAVSIAQPNAAVRRRRKVSLFDPYDEAKKPQLSSKKEEQEFFEPDTIKSKRVIAGCVEYKVSWKGYDESEDTWEPVEHCMQEPALKALVHEFKKQMYAKVKGMWHLDTPTMMKHICETFETEYGVGAFDKSEIEAMVKKQRKSRANTLCRQMRKANSNSEFAHREICIGEGHQCAVIPMCGGSLDRRDLARAGTPMPEPYEYRTGDLARKAYEAYACSQPAGSGALEVEHVRADDALHEALIKFGCIRATDFAQPRTFVNQLVCPRR